MGGDVAENGRQRTDLRCLDEIRTRQVARSYRDHGFVAIVPRLPGHGSVPAGLSKVHWEDWAAATQLAVREAVRRAGPGRPLHLVGYSNGGALALKCALDAIEDPGLPRPTRVVLISPMIGVTEMARFAGFAGLPAIFPPFAKAAWLGIVPEFNPFKYNSFPVNGARQSSLLTRALQPRLARLAREGRLADLAPVLTFQSVTDFTVSTAAVVDALYAHLPANGSELVLYDLNRHTKFGPLLRAGKETLVERLLPGAPRHYRTTVVSNAGTGSYEVAERVTEAGATAESVRPLGLRYPNDVFSLSHVALPFPEDDPVYGGAPDPAEDFGVQLGAMALRGERGTLVVSLDTLGRTSWNPFFLYQLQRIDEGIGSGLR
jgi:alpha-beta hydrolase superfamily lysophospholipase